MTSRQQKRNRTLAWLDQEGRCYWCLKSVPFTQATHEHIIPASEGGKDNRDNTAMACSACNSSRGTIRDLINQTINAELNRDSNIQELLTRFNR